MEESGRLAMWLQRMVVCSLVALVVTSCVPGAKPSSTPSGPAAPTQVPAKKRVVASIFSDPAGVYQEMTNRTVGSVSGLAELIQLMNTGLSYQDDANVYQPHLAEALPTVDNGLWTVFPDGRMQTTWHIKPNVAWHDGAPFTSEDLILTMQVNRDRDVGFPVLPNLDIVTSVEAPDPRTVVVNWSRPFIEAVSIFTPGVVTPLPQHILAAPYAEDKADLFNLPFWREEYVGTGPFKLQEWIPGSHLTLMANDAYVLGRPKIDEMEIRFITEFNTIEANFRAGAIDTHIGRGFGVEQLMQLRDVPDLNVQVGGGLLGDPIPMFPQFINTDPPIVRNVEFRRALLEAIDRQEMTDSLNYGLGPIAHTWLQPDEPEYPAIAAHIARYDYDPR